MKVLIADDSAYIRNSLQKRLNQIDEVGEVILTGNVASAIEVIEKRPPEILIIDFQFIEGTGFDVLAAGKMNPAVKICIMFTNYSNDTLRKKSYENGADYFFDKSDDFEKVIEVIYDFAKKNHINKLPNSTTMSGGC